MQLFPTLAFTFFLVFSIITLTGCQSESASKPVYLTFREIKSLIVELDTAQENAASQQQPPDFKKSTKMLVELASKADEATSLLEQLGDNELLDDQSVWHIKRSVKTSANHVQSITKMVELGKPYFDHYNVTAQVVHILQVNAYQFQLLFRELEFHSPPADYAVLGKSITLFMCSIINAIHYLDPSACTPQGLETCQKFEKDQTTCFNGHTIVKAAKKPTGMDSCGNSASSYLQSAYQNKTLGTNKVTCSSTETKTNKHFSPQSALLF